MKTIIATIAIATLTGCASMDNLIAEGQAIRYGTTGNPHGFYTQTITTPQGTYTIRGSRTTGTQIYRANR